MQPNTTTTTRSAAIVTRGQTDFLDRDLLDLDLKCATLIFHELRIVVSFNHCFEHRLVDSCSPLNLPSTSDFLSLT